MNRTHIIPKLDSIPSIFHELFNNADIYDSSCSPEAKVFFIDKGSGYYLKSAPKNSLKYEAEMTRYFCSKGLATSVLEYLSAEKDWLLTAKVSGEDCTHKMYLGEPEKLCDTTATLLRTLHETDFADCPIKNKLERYVNTVINNYHCGNYDKTAFPDSFGYQSPEEAWQVARDNMKFFKNDTLSTEIIVCRTLFWTIGNSASLSTLIMRELATNILISSGESGLCFLT